VLAEKTIQKKNASVVAIVKTYKRGIQFSFSITKVGKGELWAVRVSPIAAENWVLKDKETGKLVPLTPMGKRLRQPWYPLDKDYLFEVPEKTWRLGSINMNDIFELSTFQGRTLVLEGKTDFMGPYNMFDKRTTTKGDNATHFKIGIRLEFKVPIQSQAE